MARKAIFCLEGLWNENLRDRMTVRYMLELVERRNRVPFIHRTTGTVPELEFYLSKWTQSRYDNYRILYFAYHGKPGQIQFGKEGYTLDQLSRVLWGQCGNSIIIFSSCSTLDIDLRRIKRFIRESNALAVCGYRVDVDWMKSYAFELLLMSAMQDNEFSGRGIQAIKNRIHREIGTLARELKFHMVTKRELI